MRTFLYTMFLIFVSSFSSHGFAQQESEENTDRLGLDYRSFNMRSNNAEHCKQACFADSQCKAWTFVKARTIQGSHPRCWLKKSVPPPTANNCCTSGKIEIPAMPPPPPIPLPNLEGCVPLICCTKPSLDQCNP